MTSWIPGRHPEPETLDEVLDGAGSVAARRHVDGCPSCRDALDDLRLAREALHRARISEIALPAGLADRLAEAIAAETSRRADGVASLDAGRRLSDEPPLFELGVSGSVESARRRRWLPALAVAASLATVGLGGGLLLQQQGSGSATSSAEGAAAPAADASPPADASVESKGYGASDLQGASPQSRADSTDLNPSTLPAALLLRAEGPTEALPTAPASSGAQRCWDLLGLHGGQSFGAVWEGKPALVYVAGFDPGSQVVVVDGGCQIASVAQGDGVFRYDSTMPGSAATG